MADGMGPDFLTRSMFFREAEAGPSQQDLATMTAPFMGNPQQAASFMGSPAMQQHLAQYGIHFDPNQIRQSPFLPNQFMHGHPGIGGAMTGAMANAASTPEAPMVSGAGSGISRAMQGMYGGPELLRQYQVRQMMAPMQAMGMQLPVRAEERRQQLLQALIENMQHREAQTPVQHMRDEIFTEPGMPGYFTRQQPHQIQDMPMPGGAGPGAAMGHPAMPFPGVPGGFPQSQGAGMSPGGIQFNPWDPGQVQQMGQIAQLQHPERAAGADLSRAKAAEQTQETGAGMPQAKVQDVKAQAGQRQAMGAAATTRANKMASPAEKTANELAKTDRWFGSQVQQINSHYDRNITLAETPEQRAVFQAQKEQALQQLVNNYNQASQRSQGAPTDIPKQQGQQGPLGPGVPPPAPPKKQPKTSSKPQGTPGRGAQAGGAGANIPATTAINPQANPYR